MTTTTDSQNRTANADESGKLSGATGRVRDVASGARSRASDAYSTARDRTRSAYSTGRETAASAARRTAERVEANPVIAVAGGLAIGAVLGALLPRTQREQETLGNVGHKLTDAAREAANTAVETGRQQVNELTSSAVQKVGEAVVQAVVSGDGANAQ